MPLVVPFGEVARVVCVQVWVAMAVVNDQVTGAAIELPANL